MRTVYYSLGKEPAERVIGLLELFCAEDAPESDEAARATDAAGGGWSQGNYRPQLHGSISGRSRR